MTITADDVRDMLRNAEALGLKLFLHPVMAAKVRELGLWNDAVCVETKPVPLH